MTFSGKTVEEEAAVYDLILLTELSEAAIIRNTKNLYYENIIYSYVGKWNDGCCCFPSNRF